MKKLIKTYNKKIKFNKKNNNKKVINYHKKIKNMKSIKKV